VKLADYKDSESGQHEIEVIVFLNETRDFGEFFGIAIVILAAPATAEVVHPVRLATGGKQKHVDLCKYLLLTHVHT